MMGLYVPVQLNTWWQHSHLLISAWSASCMGPCWWVAWLCYLFSVATVDSNKMPPEGNASINHTDNEYVMFTSFTTAFLFLYFIHLHAASCKTVTTRNTSEGSRCVWPWSSIMASFQFTMGRHNFRQMQVCLQYWPKHIKNKNQNLAKAIISYW